MTDENREGSTGPDGRADPPDEADPPDSPGQAREVSTADRNSAGETVRDTAGTDGPAEGGDTDDDGGAVEADSPGEDHDPEAYTTDVRTLDPRVRWLWILRGLVLAAVLGGATAGITLAVAPGLTWLGAAVGVVLAALGAGHALLLYRSWEYRVRDDSMYLHRGVVTRVQTVVPYVRVQHIDTSRGPIERAVGLSSLVVYTAGSRGADVTVPGLTPAEATDLQTRLKALAIESEGEDAV